MIQYILHVNTQSFNVFFNFICFSNAYSFFLFSPCQKIAFMYYCPIYLTIVYIFLMWTYLCPAYITILFNIPRFYYCSVCFIVLHIIMYFIDYFPACIMKWILYIPLPYMHYSRAVFYCPCMYYCPLYSIALYYFPVHIIALTCGVYHILYGNLCTCFAWLFGFFLINLFHFFFDIKPVRFLRVLLTFSFLFCIHANFPDLVGIFPILHAIPDFPIGIPNNTRNPDFVKIHPDLRQWPPISDSNSKSRAGSLGLTNQKSGSQNRHYCLPVSRVGMCIHNLPL